MELNGIRERIDEIDTQLARLLKDRMALVSQVAEYKQAHHLPVTDRVREQRIVADLTAQTGCEEIGFVYQALFAVSRARQTDRLAADSPLARCMREAVSDLRDALPREARVACQGIEGAYSQLLAQRMFPRGEIVFVPDFEDVFRQVESGRCDYGVLPIENSTAGSVTQVYDRLKAHSVYLVGGGRLPVSHVLWGKPGAELGGITTVISHEQALRQCAERLKQLGVKTVPVENTAVAARMVAEGDRTDVAALASQACGERYGLTAMRRDLADSRLNSTRFVCIARELELYRTADRLSVRLTLPHESGALYRLLAVIAAENVNLTKLESRPLPDTPYEYSFFFDLEGNLTQPKIRRVLLRMAGEASSFTLLGNYEEMTEWNSDCWAGR